MKEEYFENSTGTDEESDELYNKNEKEADKYWMLLDNSPGEIQENEDDEYRDKYEYEYEDRYVYSYKEELKKAEEKYKKDLEELEEMQSYEYGYNKLGFRTKRKKNIDDKNEDDTKDNKNEKNFLNLENMYGRYKKISKHLGDVFMIIGLILFITGFVSGKIRNFPRSADRNLYSINTETEIGEAKNSEIKEYFGDNNITSDDSESINVDFTLIKSLSDNIEDIENMKVIKPEFIDNSYIFEKGMYEVGYGFEEGIYDITRIEGSALVYIDNEDDEKKYDEECVYIFGDKENEIKDIKECKFISNSKIYIIGDDIKLKMEKR